MIFENMVIEIRGTSMSDGCYFSIRERKYLTGYVRIISYIGIQGIINLWSEIPKGMGFPVNSMGKLKVICKSEQPIIRRSK